MDENFKKPFAFAIISAIVISSVISGGLGFWFGTMSGDNAGLSQSIRGLFWDKPLAEIATDLNQVPAGQTIVTVDQESSVVSLVEKVSPAVVSIIVTKDLPIMERNSRTPDSNFFRRFFGDDFDEFFGDEVPQDRQQGTQRQEIGGGSGFIVSSDGYIITNKHVVDDEEADYTVLLNDESRVEAKVLDRDLVNDIAILKIEKENLPVAPLGDSTNLKAGQTVVAIGNALGEFRNTVSTGVISGLARSVTAGSFGFGSEQLVGVIQTDASINPGNSGGPLLNIAGQVIGVNTAMAQGAENIGFAIPVNEVKSIYESVKQNGRIVRPWLGVRYVMINEMIKEENRLTVDDGALIVRGEDMTELAVVPGSPADKAGLRENDIILELDGVVVNETRPLANVISGHKPGDEVTLKLQRQGEEQTVKVKLEEMK